MSALREAQLRMAGHLRDPLANPPPDEVEDRRLAIYRDLVFNSIERFLHNGFPVLHSLYDAGQWNELVRGFLASHRCRSPLFHEISQEFLQYLMEEHAARDCDPPFMQELAHYEWVELALDVAGEELPPARPRQVAEIGDAVLCLSPLAWVLSYRFPVHRIGASFRPREPAEPTYLAVYRNRDDEVKFLELNAATARLLELLRDNASRPAAAVLDTLAGELGLEPATVRAYGGEQLRELLGLSVVLPLVNPR